MVRSLPQTLRIHQMLLGIMGGAILYAAANCLYFQREPYVAVSGVTAESKAKLGDVPADYVAAFAEHYVFLWADNNPLNREARLLSMFVLSEPKLQTQLRAYYKKVYPVDQATRQTNRARILKSTVHPLGGDRWAVDVSYTVESIYGGLGEHQTRETLRLVILRRDPTADAPYVCRVSAIAPVDEEPTTP